jgi:hypothetical protein
MAKNNASVDGSTIDRQIYNPYPRVVGEAAKSGMSRGAAHILSRLGVYTNPSGETFAGYDLLEAETQSSTGYVNEAMKELYALGRLSREKRYNRRNGARLSDVKQIWCSRDELLAAGVKEADLHLYPTKSRETFDAARSAFQSKASDKPSTDNKTNNEPSSVFRRKVSRDGESVAPTVTEVVTLEPNSCDPIENGCPNSDTLFENSRDDAENTTAYSVSVKIEPYSKLQSRTYMNIEANTEHTTPSASAIESFYLRKQDPEPLKMKCSRCQTWILAAEYYAHECRAANTG